MRVKAPLAVNCVPRTDPNESRAVVAYARGTLLIGGGVAANQRLRERLAEAAERDGFTLHFAPREFCTDNAAMAAIAWEALERGTVADLDIDVTPGLIRGA